MVEKQKKSLEHSLANCLLRWTVTRDQDNVLHVKGTYFFPLGFAGFDGHFPNRAVLPAIVQLGAVRYLAGRAVEQRLVPKTYRRMKFRAMIEPEEEVAAEVVLKRTEHGWAVKFTISRQGKAVSSGSMDLLPAEDAG